MHVFNEQRPHLLKMLTQAQAALALLFDTRVRHLGLTRPQWRIVEGLIGNTGITQTELSELTDIARSPLGKIVDQLESKGYLERRDDPDDRRINRLYLTEGIRPLLQPARELATELEDTVLEGLNAETLTLLSDMVTRLEELTQQEIYHATC